MLPPTPPTPTHQAAGGPPPIIDMETEFLNLGLDIIGLGVFNYDFGSITRESPVIKVGARRTVPCCGIKREGGRAQWRLWVQHPRAFPVIKVGSESAGCVWEVRGSDRSGCQVRCPGCATGLLLGMPPTHKPTAPPC